LKVSEDELRKPVPPTISVREAAPAITEEGARLVMEGFGFDGVNVKVTGCELPPPGGGFVTTAG